jgi:MFS family permease
MSEYAGKAHRGMLVSLVFAMQAAGLIVGPLLAALLLSTHLSHDIIWRILVSFGAIPALAVYDARRHLKETPRFLKAAGQEEDETGNLNSLSILISTLTLSRSGMASIVWSMTREFLSASSVQVQLGF